MLLKQKVMFIVGEIFVTRDEQTDIDEISTRPHKNWIYTLYLV